MHGQHTRVHSMHEADNRIPGARLAGRTGWLH